MSKDKERFVCVDCSAPFTLSEGEREFYAEKGFPLPKRCNNCRKARKAERQAREK